MPQVIILDEFEKAADEIQDILLNVFDAGWMASSSGLLADARHAIFILTTNAAASLLTLDKYPCLALQSVPATPEEMSEFGAAISVVQRDLFLELSKADTKRPEFRGFRACVLSLGLVGVRQFTLIFCREFLNRMSAIVPFRPLGDDHILARAALQKAGQLLAQQEGAMLRWTAAAEQRISQLAHQSGGARSFQREVKPWMLQVRVCNFATWLHQVLFC